VFTFNKSERLRSKKAIEILYLKGKSKNFFPIRIVVLKNNLDILSLEKKSPVRFMVSVPKKRFKLAVKRNRVKRLIREAWRLNKHILYAELERKNLSCDVMFLYMTNEIPTLELIQKKLPGIFNFILEEIIID